MARRPTQLTGIDSGPHIVVIILDPAGSQKDAALQFEIPIVVLTMSHADCTYTPSDTLIDRRIAKMATQSRGWQSRHY